MKIFIWEYLNELTDRYHPEGGIVVIAATVERAREIAYQQGVKFDQNELVPDHEYQLAEDVSKEDYFIFPNAGCC